MPVSPIPIIGHDPIEIPTSSDISLTVNLLPHFYKTRILSVILLFLQVDGRPGHSSFPLNSLFFKTSEYD
jgi:hypothetical protein